MRRFGTPGAENTTAAILAGGAATRLGGRDKGLAMLAGRPLVEHVLEAVRPQVAAVLIVANRHLDDYRRLAPTVSDATPGLRGPLAGIVTALRTARTGWILTLPVDCPAPPGDLYARLAHTCDASAARCAVVHDGDRIQPLFALYHRDLASEARCALAESSAVWRWQQACAAIVVDFADRPHAFANLNTPDDFAAFVTHR